MEILEPRVEGHTCEKIADRLGYKNHSGVVKRMEAIKKRFIQYEKTQGAKATQAGNGGRGFLPPKPKGKKVRMFNINDLPPIEVVW